METSDREAHLALSWSSEPKRKKGINHVFTRLHFADDDITQPMVDPPVGLLGGSGVIGTLPEKEEDEATTRDVELNCDQGLANC